MSSLTGESYAAKFDGGEYPLKGDRGGSTVSLKRVDERTVRETMKREGKVVSISLMQVAMNLTIEDTERGTTLALVAHKK